MKRFLKYLLVSCCGLFFAHTAFAQPEEIARVKKDLKGTTVDSVRMKLYSKLCLQYNGVNYDSALYYGNKSVQLARKIHSVKGIEDCLTELAGLYFQAGKFPQSIKSLMEVLKLAEDNKDQKTVENTLSNLAVVYHNLKDYDKALEYYQRALAYSEQKQNNDATISLQLSNIGMLYKDKGEIGMATKMTEKALHRARLSKDSLTLARALNNIAELYGMQGQDQKSKAYYLQAYDIQEKLGNARGIFITSSNLAAVYSDQQRYDSSLFFGNIALEKAKMFNAPHYYKTIYEVLATLYKRKKDYQTALQYYQLFQSYKDSIFNEENSRIISDLKTKYAVDKRTAELNAKAGAEKEKAEALRKEEERRSTIVVGFISGILLLVCVFSFFLYKRFNLTKKQKRIIEIQKVKVEEKNREITDSINYAKRLQEAILPPLSFWNEQLPDSFVYYRPKDIVAGDFYFMERMQHKIIFAAADCTGHGVPGAMVSIVCANALARTVKEFAISDAGKILDKVTELVQETFAKSESEVKDGMDISLCVLDTQTLALTWAGANNPLWFARKDKTEITEIKADKQPIGKTDHGKAFRSHQLQMQKGDLVYLFTDGYADQFGTGGKKFKLKKLRALISENMHQSIQEQHATIMRSFEQWKGSLEQIDDLCVIGIRI